jgi:hypothetical protein
MKRSPSWFAVVLLAVRLICAAEQNSDSFISRYQARVTATQAAQPHWVTPLVTVTPRLEQEVRADFVRQRDSQHFNTWNLGNSKGLELIPERHIELVFNVPPFFDHTQPGQKDGFGDVSFLAKYRIFSRNEEQGNGIVTAFLGATVPTGKNGNGSCCAVVTPTLAAGKGFGQIAVTSTAGGSLPISNSIGLGHTITWNNAIQYRVGKTGPARFCGRKSSSIAVSIKADQMTASRRHSQRRVSSSGASRCTIGRGLPLERESK